MMLLGGVLDRGDQQLYENDPSTKRQNYWDEWRADTHVSFPLPPPP